MNDEYRVPKHTIPAEVFLPGRPALPVDLFLSEFAERHSGVERPSDLINGPDRFLVVIGPDGNMLFLQRDAVLMVSVPAHHEFGPEVSEALVYDSDEAVREEVRLQLEDGTEVRGTLSFVMPEGMRRIQDYLNHSDRFLAVRDGETARLVNKKRIVHVAALSNVPAATQRG